MNLRDAIECGMTWGLNVIMKRDEDYIPCRSKIEDMDFFESQGGEYFGTVHDCYYKYVLKGQNENS